MSSIDGYIPAPIDVSHIRLDGYIVDLIERLAENSHDLWAVRRINEGWIWGPERNESEKKHPDLVPYADLPDSEKEYDRDAAIGTIKAILALGYRISKV